MDEATLKKRTKAFALRVIKLTDSLGWAGAAGVIGKQLQRSGTSVGANYRAACRAKSTADFIHKMGTVEEEADECLYWMELLVEAGLVTKDQLGPLRREADELVAITVSAIRTTRAKGS